MLVHNAYIIALLSLALGLCQPIHGLTILHRPTTDSSSVECTSFKASIVPGPTVQERDVVPLSIAPRSPIWPKPVGRIKDRSQLRFRNKPAAPPAAPKPSKAETSPLRYKHKVPKPKITKEQQKTRKDAAAHASLSKALRAKGKAAQTSQKAVDAQERAKLRMADRKKAAAMGPHLPGQRRPREKLTKEQQAARKGATTRGSKRSKARGKAAHMTEKSRKNQKIADRKQAGLPSGKPKPRPVKISKEAQAARKAVARASSPVHPPTGNPTSMKEINRQIKSFKSQEKARQKLADRKEANHLLHTVPAPNKFAAAAKAQKDGHASMPARSSLFATDKGVFTGKDVRTAAFNSHLFGSGGDGNRVNFQPKPFRNALQGPPGRKTRPLPGMAGSGHEFPISKAKAGFQGDEPGGARVILQGNDFKGVTAHDGARKADHPGYNDHFQVPETPVSGGHYKTKPFPTKPFPRPVRTSPAENAWHSSQLPGSDVFQRDIPNAAW